VIKGKKRNVTLTSHLLPPTEPAVIPEGQTVSESLNFLARSLGSIVNALPPYVRAMLALVSHGTVKDWVSLSNWDPGIFSWMSMASFRGITINVVPM
jgi:hypothetical protein